MKKLLLLFGLSLLCFPNLLGQERYIDQIFSDYNIDENILYATNKGVPITLIPSSQLLGQLETISLSCIPTGTRQDSSMVYLARNLVKRGFVVSIIDHRKGWSPTSSDYLVREGSLYEAYYRSIQDVRTCVRYFNKSHSEGNPYGVDPNAIAVAGQGPGGFIVYGVSSLNNESKLVQSEFANNEDGTSLVNTASLGNIYGTNDTDLNIGNHVEYSSDIHFGMSFGGTVSYVNDWLDAETSPLIAVQLLDDPFARYDCYPNIISGVEQPPFGDDGAKCVIARANEVGANDILLDAEFSDPYSLRAMEVEPEVPNLFGIVTDESEHAPWNFWDEEYWSNITCLFNANTNVHDYSVQYNPDFSVEKSLAYIDTVANYFVTRAVIAMNLNDAQSSGIDNTMLNTGITVAPNPTCDVFYIQLKKAVELNEATLYDLSGKQVVFSNTISSDLMMDVSELSNGIYVLALETVKQKQLAACEGRAFSEPRSIATRVQPWPHSNIDSACGKSDL